MKKNKEEILNALQIQQKLNRIAYQIYESNFDEKEIILVGIVGNGYKVAEQLASILKKIAELKITLGKVTLDKNEPWKHPISCSINEKDYKNKAVILVDDVLNSGKTMMYAVKLFLDQPVKHLQVAVLVDRSHKRFPVHADFVGVPLSTTLQEHIVADLSAKGKEIVYLE